MVEGIVSRQGASDHYGQEEGEVLVGSHHTLCRCDWSPAGGLPCQLSLGWVPRRLPTRRSDPHIRAASWWHQDCAPNAQQERHPIVLPFTHSPNANKSF